MGDKNFEKSISSEELMRVAREFDEGTDINVIWEELARGEEYMKKYAIEYWELHPEAYVCPYEAPAPRDCEREPERTKEEGNCSESTSGSVTGSDLSPPEKAQLKNSPEPETIPGKPQFCQNPKSLNL